MLGGIFIVRLSTPQDHFWYGWTNNGRIFQSKRAIFGDQKWSHWTTLAPDQLFHDSSPCMHTYVEAITEP